MNSRGNYDVLLAAMARGSGLLRDAHVRRCCNGPLPDLSVLSAADAHQEWSVPGGSSPLGAARRRRRATEGEAVRLPRVGRPTIGEQRKSSPPASSRRSPRTGVRHPTLLTSPRWRTAQPRFCQFCRVPAARTTGHDLVCSLHWGAPPWISRSAGFITTRTAV